MKNFLFRIFPYIHYYFYTMLYYFCSLMTWLLAWPFILLGGFVENRRNKWKFVKDLYERLRDAGAFNVGRKDS